MKAPIHGWMHPSKTVSNCARFRSKCKFSRQRAGAVVSQSTESNPSVRKTGHAFLSSWSSRSFGTNSISLSVTFPHVEIPPGPLLCVRPAPRPANPLSPLQKVEPYSAGAVCLPIATVTRGAWCWQASEAGSRNNNIKNVS